MNRISMNHPYVTMAQQVATHLLAHQVIAGDIELDFSRADSHRVDIVLFRSVPGSVNLRVGRTRAGAFRVSTDVNAITVPPGQFFRIAPGGGLGTLTQFYGLKPAHKGIDPGPQQLSDESSSVYARIKKPILAILECVPGAVAFLKTVRDRLFPEPASDLQGYEGVTFRFSTAASSDSGVRLVCYDEGGIYDEHLNAEGLDYPPQVAGNYYADAYSALVFLKLFRLTGDRVWQEASLASQRFLRRVYPQYEPASIVWHHSDFKNAGILELLLCADAADLAAQWDLCNDLAEDRYEPTNVFALRYHCNALLARLTGDPGFREKAALCAGRLRQDQTLDGLFHDNIDTYPDAHDATYHQYSTACLGMGLLHSRDDRDGWEMFRRAAGFSLHLVSPQGEVAYVGRAANNIHHSASAILLFHIAAESSPESGLKGAYIRAARVVAERLRTFITPSGMLPTAMNRFPEIRMAWNHCETPYNALVAFMLIRSAELAGSLDPETESLLPLETDHLWIANDAGFASMAFGGMYLVVFGGCSRSYGWSEHRHVAGCGGIALFGRTWGPEILPGLDTAIPSETAISDLPVINGHAGFGRADLSRPELLEGIVYRHRYAGAHVARLYLLTQAGLIVVTRISPSGSEVHVRGAAAWTLCDSDGWSHRVDSRGQTLRISGPDLVELTVTACIPDGELEPAVTVSDRVSNPKAMARRVEFGEGRITRPLVSVLGVGFGESGPVIRTAGMTGDHLTLEMRGNTLSIPVRCLGIGE